MRHEPSVITWIIQCRSRESVGRVTHLLGQITQPDYVITDEVRSFPDGVEDRQNQTHRVGDYFREIRWDSSADDPLALRLFFTRSLQSPRFWKDVMARILQSVRNSAQDAEIRREPEAAGKAK
jgi:hypothetical protein